MVEYLHIFLNCFNSNVILASAATAVDPRNLGRYDLVIVALDTLREEIHLQQADDHVGPVTRQARVYSRPISPLLCLEWRLLVVDETQKIEGEGNASKMSMRLTAKQRFVVSGTPMGHSQVDDLQFLLRFLRITPFDNPDTWRILVSSLTSVRPKAAYSRLLHLIKQIMLRRRREDVADEFVCTPQQMEVRSLQFSSFEQMEYDTHEQEALAAVRMTPRSSSKKLQLAIDNIETLRKSCCHPQAFNRSGRHNPLTYDDIILSRIERLGVELEEAQRKMLFNLTSLAGCIQLLAWDENKNGGKDHLQNIIAAAQLYVLALRSIERNRQVCDLLGIGLISEDDNSLCMESKAVRLDAMHFTWRKDDVIELNSSNSDDARQSWL